MLAVTTAERARRWPEVPTLRELGFETLVATNWFGISAPAGLPAAPAEAINAALLAAMRNPAMRERLPELGATPNQMSRDNYASLIATEVARWADIVRAADIRAE
jgi:tripartite-type tricarboxylate transporter receptor subunit TctC